MSRDRGIRLQNALADYLRQWWPSAESAGSGRPGSDVLGTPGIVWESKAADEFRPLAFVKQAKAHSRVRQIARLDATGRDSGATTLVADIPVAVYWPRGSGAKSAEVTIAMLPLGVLVRLLREAGYGSD